MSGTWEGVGGLGVGLDGVLLHWAGGSVRLVLHLVEMQELVWGLGPHGKAGGMQRLEGGGDGGRRYGSPQAVVKRQILKWMGKVNKGDEKGSYYCC